MKLSDFSGKPCKSRVAFEFIPKKKARLNLMEVARKLKEKGIFIDAETISEMWNKVRESGLHELLNELDAEDGYESEVVGETEVNSAADSE